MRDEVFWVVDSERSGIDEPSAVAGQDLAERLLGAALPTLTLDSTEGRINLSELAGDLLVLFVYPHATGLPDAPVSGWDLIPGARGCTAQACGFRDHHRRLRTLGAHVAGLSVQTVEEQRAFAARVELRYPLISDPKRRLAAALGLPTFTADGRIFYRRLTLIGKGARIVKVFSPVTQPEGNAGQVATWLEAGDGVELA
jgi:peroxiredoxin